MLAEHDDSLFSDLTGKLQAELSYHPQYNSETIHAITIDRYSIKNVTKLIGRLALLHMLTFIMWCHVTVKVKKKRNLTLFASVQPQTAATCHETAIVSSRSTWKHNSAYFNRGWAAKIDLFSWGIEKFSQKVTTLYLVRWLRPIEIFLVTTWTWAATTTAHYSWTLPKTNQQM